MIKTENFNKEGQIKVRGSFSEKAAVEVFAVKHFTMVTNFFIQMPKYKFSSIGSNKLEC